MRKRREKGGKRESKDNFAVRVKKGFEVTFEDIFGSFDFLIGFTP